MGVQLSLLVQSYASIGVSSYIDVLDEVHYISQLNSSRFLRTCKALDPNGEIIIKVFIKPTENYKLDEINNELETESRLLSPLPNILNYSKLIESNRAGYLIRQQMKCNLYDRLSTRPYLQDIEIKFITFQLLQAVQDIHNLDITHGDLKTENILVTSWNWIVITDFASHLKPAYLPEDNPGEFLFYFDTSKRRICYLAPERFDSRSTNDSSGKYTKVTKEMDIFSVGCCIAEIFSEGRPLFNLSQLFKYKNMDYDIDNILDPQLPSSYIKSLILDMIDIDPSKRLSAQHILEKYRGSIFPDYFYTFTYDYFRTLATSGTSVPTSGEIFVHTTLEDKNNILDESCEHIYTSFSKICSSLGYPIVNEKKLLNFENIETYQNYLSNSINLAFDHNIILQSFDPKIDVLKDECAILFISFICHGLRNIVSSETKLKCIELLTVFSQYVSDENKIDRVVPYLVSMFEDRNPNIQALALQSLSQVLRIIKELNPLNENVFVDYLLPRIKRLLVSNRQDPFVRITFANCLSDFITSATRFQEMSFSFHSNHSVDSVIEDLENLEVVNKYNKKLLHQIEELTVTLLIDNNSRVKIALLNNILPLCKFFGRERTNDIILSHLITYLNDRDPALRINLIQAISGIAVLLGPIAIEQYILPLLIQTITDSEELVVVSVIQSLKDLCKTGLIHKKFFYDIASTVSTLLLHPNNWIRQFTLILIIEISSKLSNAEVYCILYPIVRPYFEFDVEFTLDLMLSSCKQPITRKIYDLLCSWSLRSSKTLFWQKIPNKTVDSFGNSTILFATKDYSIKNYGFSNKVKLSKAVLKAFNNEEIPLTAEDKNWIDKFKTLGLSEKEFWKIAILRGYVLRTSQLLSKKSELSNENKLYGLNYLNEFPNILPKNVFFDLTYKDKRAKVNQSTTNICKKQWELPKTITNLGPIKDLNGSLFFKSKISPTTNSNLENIYVQLESTSQEVESDIELFSNESSSKHQFFVSNSYEGDDLSVKQFLENFDIQYPLKEFKEFGPNVGSIENLFKLDSFQDQLVLNLIENDSSALVSISILNGPMPIMVTGSVEGVLKLWNLSDLVIGESYSPILQFDCVSTISDIIMVPGFECFAVSTKDGYLWIFRVIFSGLENDKSIESLRCIRKTNLNDSENDISATKLKITDMSGNLLLFALTTKSDIHIFDIRTMSETLILKNPSSHGAVVSFAIDHNASTLITGTTKGILGVWDLRFGILIKSWIFGDYSPITDIETFDNYGSNLIVVSGGHSETLFTVWDYSKTQCKYVTMDSNKEPSIELFIPIEKNIEKMKFDSSDYKYIPRIIKTSGNIIFATDLTSNEIVALDMRNISNSKILLSKNDVNSQFSFVKLTANLTYISRSELSKESNCKPNKFCFHNDIINTNTFFEMKGQNILISADNSGVINIFT